MGKREKEECGGERRADFLELEQWFLPQAHAIDIEQLTQIRLRSRLHILRQRKGWTREMVFERRSAEATAGVLGKPQQENKALGHDRALYTNDTLAILPYP